MAKEKNTERREQEENIGALISPTKYRQQRQPIRHWCYWISSRSRRPSITSFNVHDINY